MTTRLDIINACLAVTGESPLNEEDGRHPTVVTVLRLIDQMSTSLQDNAGRGWWFNRAIVTLKQDISGKVLVPVDMINVLPTSAQMYYVRRGQYMYDPANDTTSINQDVPAKVVRKLDFEDLPSVAQLAIQSAVIMRFQPDFDADTAKTQIAAQFKSEDLLALRSAEITNSRANTSMNPEVAQFRTGFIAMRRRS